MKTEDVQSNIEPTTAEVRDVIDEAERTLAAHATMESGPHADHPPDAEQSAAKQPTRRAVKKLSRTREVAVTGAGAVVGESARRAVVDAIDRKKVIDVARHVASSKTKGMTDGQVLEFIASNDGFRKSLGGHLHEALDAADLKQIYDLRKTLGMSEGRWLKLYAEHNRKGLDGAYKGARKAGDAVFAQHKLSDNPQQLKKAAEKVGKTVRGKTELVVARGTNVDGVTEGLKGSRQVGRTLKQINGMVEKAADPKKVTDIGAKSAQKLSLKAGAASAGIGVGISVACDANRLRKGEIALAEAAENAAWAGGEAAACTLAAAGATAAAAPAIAAGTAALAASTAAGTTVAAAGLAALGPVGLGIGISIGIGIGIKKVRKATRGA